MRKQIYHIIEKDVHNDVVSRCYDIVMVIMILISIIPLMYIDTYPIFSFIEWGTVSVFILDYMLRWSTADFSLGKGLKSFLIYPFTPMAIVDLLSILPVMNLLSPTFKLLRFSRLVRIIRVFKFFRYSDKVMMFVRVLNKEKNVLFSVLMLALLYIFITALIMFNAEPHINPATGETTFSSFFDALYWATVTLTTVGYGDLCPVTDIGRVVSMLSSLFGVAIIALPSGVITASYLDELREAKTMKENEQSEKI
jgi:voltage-gated potassium channel